MNMKEVRRTRMAAAALARKAAAALACPSGLCFVTGSCARAVRTGWV